MTGSNENRDNAGLTKTRRTLPHPANGEFVALKDKMHEDRRPFANRHFEAVERDAWLDMFAAVPDDCARKLGIASHRLGDTGVLASREVPIVEFNRAMCIGMAAPATSAILDEASEWLLTNAAPGWALQVGPVARTTVIDDWLQRHTMTASGAGWAKFQREATPAAQARISTVDVRLVDAGNAEAFGAVVQAGFGLPAETAKWFAALSGRPGWTLYLAYEGETPVASGAAFASQAVAWFGIDATLADYRRRGADGTDPSPDGGWTRRRAHGIYRRDRTTRRRPGSGPHVLQQLPARRLHAGLRAGELQTRGQPGLTY
jgi:hypothetical protein